MSPIRVLQVIGSMNRGGAETMIMNLYRKIDREKIQFDFVVHTDKPCAYDDEILFLGGRIWHCPRFAGSNVFSYRRWWNAFFTEHASDYPVVHGHIGSSAAVYLKAAKKSGLFTVAHSHSSGTDHSARSFLYRAFSYPTRHIADWFFACSIAVGVDRYGQAVVDSSRFRILNNAIDTVAFRYEEDTRRQIREELGVADSLVVGHVGRFDAVKNQPFAVRSFQALTEKHPDARLLLVGNGAEKPEVEALVRTLDLSDRVIFTGVRADVALLLQAMDVFLFPSIYEGLPVTLVEAQCAGLPCVISDTIPPDCIVTEGLVVQKSLNDGPISWADQLLACAAIQRTDHSQEIIAHGFDVNDTARKLEEFYLEKCR